MKDNAFGRLIGALLAPGETFQSISQRPGWAVALLTLCGVSLLTNVVAVPRIDWEAATRAQLERSGRDLSGEQLEQAIEVGSKVGSVAAYLAPVWVTIGYLLMALACWAIYSLLGGELSFKKSLATSLHATMPWAVAGLLTIPILLGQSSLDAERLQNGEYLLSSLAAFAGESTGRLGKALLGSLDVFSVWTIVLLAIGFSVTAKLPRGKAAGGAVVLWALWVAVKLGLTALGQAAS